MIFGNIDKIEEYRFLTEELLQCFQYAKEQDLINFKTGSYEIDGERLFVNIVEYETEPVSKRFWEAHRKYLDVHLMLSGAEQIDMNFLQNMEVKEYEEAKDFVPMEGEKNGSLVLRDGDFLVCYPSDGHRTAVAAGDSRKIKKAIFKILI